MIILALVLAAAQSDKPGTRDYPLVQRFPHQFISSATEKDWDTFDFQSKPRSVVEGHSFRINYGLENGAEKPSGLEWMRNYQNALTSAGWTVDTAHESGLVDSAKQAPEAKKPAPAPATPAPAATPDKK